MASYSYTAFIEQDPETGLYVGIIPAVHGAHTQGATLDELVANLHEVLALCLEEEASQGGSAEPADH